MYIQNDRRAACIHFVIALCIGVTQPPDRTNKTNFWPIVLCRGVSKAFKSYFNSSVVVVAVCMCVCAVALQLYQTTVRKRIKHSRCKCVRLYNIVVVVVQVANDQSRGATECVLRQNATMPQGSLETFTNKDYIWLTRDHFSSQSCPTDQHISLSRLLRSRNVFGPRRVFNNLKYPIVISL